MECRLTPLFDNGTSLGYERFPADVMNWDEVRVDKYINKGNHLLRWTLAENQPEIRGHFNLLERALLEWPEIRAEVGSKLNFSKSELSDSIIDLCQLDVPVKLSADRMEFIIRLTERRLNKLKSIFNE